MQAMLTALVSLLVFAAAVALAPFAYAGWRRLTSRDGDLQIWRAMRRVGIEPDAARGPDAELARAVRRCVLCPSIEECDQWLASGGREGLGHFCPNARFLAELKDQRRS
jgi:hypothetical protein